MRSKSIALKFTAATAAAIAGWASTSACAQQFPAKTIRIVVGYTAGGTADLVSRLVARSMSEKVGQQVFVDNRPSAGGLLANELVANAAPDGYTLLLANSSFAYLPALYTKLNFDTRKDFVPVALVATTQNLLVVHPAVPVKNVKDLIALAKKKRGGLNYASAGIGGSTHLATALFMSMTDTDITQIPYKGNSQSITDLISGEVDITIAPIPVLLPPVNAKKLRAIATTGEKRSPIMPDVPTIAESGVPGMPRAPGTAMSRRPRRRPRFSRSCPTTSCRFPAPAHFPIS